MKIHFIAYLILCQSLYSLYRHYLGLKGYTHQSSVAIMSYRNTYGVAVDGVCGIVNETNLIS